MKNIHTVVLADDNPNLCEIINNALKKTSNFEVVGIANDGVEALELIEETKPDLLILDIIMPILDGLGVLEKLSELDIENKPKVIVLSGIGQDDITFRAMNSGAQYYMIKPFEIKAFIKRLNQFVESEGIEKDKKHIPLDTHLEISNVFKKIGLPTHTKGYTYLKESLLLVFEDISVLNKITTYLYPEIAKKYDTTPSRVERAIRNTINITLDRGDADFINEIFKSSLVKKNGKITNSEFISVMANLVRENI